MLKVYYQISRYDKDQSLKSKSRKRLSRSFVKQFLQTLFNSFKNSSVNEVSITDVDGTARSMSVSAGYRLYASHSGGNSYNGAFPNADRSAKCPAHKMGIVIGTGVGAVAMADRYMGTYIPNGTETDELEYLSCGVSDYTESDPNASFVLERFFRNGSGGTVSISEAGVCCQSYLSASFGNYTSSAFMLIRDLVSPAEDVADGEYLKITYTFQIEA